MLLRLANTYTKEAIRFFLISLAGLGIDIGVAWVLIAFSGASDSVAAIVGFSVATITNYFGHQLWTFREGEQRVSLRRFVAFAGVVVLTLAIRLVVLDFLGPLLPGKGLNAPIRLGLASTVSFFVAFLLSKFLIFHPRVDSRIR